MTDRGSRDLWSKCGVEKRRVGWQNVVRRRVERRRVEKQGGGGVLS